MTADIRPELANTLISMINANRSTPLNPRQQERLYLQIRYMRIPVDREPGGRQMLRTDTFVPIPEHFFPATITELSEKLDMTRHDMQNLMRRHKVRNLVHSPQWKRVHEGANWERVYAVGAGRDAPSPRQQMTQAIYAAKAQQTQKRSTLGLQSRRVHRISDEEPKVPAIGLVAAARNVPNSVFALGAR